MKYCIECGKELTRKVWQGKKRKHYEANKRFSERMFCDNVCRSNHLSKTSSGENNYFYGKHLNPWNKGIRKESFTVKPKNPKEYNRIFFWDGEKYRFKYEHRDIYEKHNGEICDGLIIHHIDMDRKNNDINNLIAVTRKEHRQIHAETGIKQV